MSAERRTMIVKTTSILLTTAPRNSLGSFFSGIITAGAYGVALDASGSVYVGDAGNNRIRKVAAAGVVTTILAQSGLTGANSVNVSLSVTGLAAQSTYYYRAQATNSAGTNTGETLSAEPPRNAPAMPSPRPSRPPITLITIA